MSAMLLGPVIACAADGCTMRGTSHRFLGKDGRVLSLCRYHRQKALFSMTSTIDMSFTIDGKPVKVVHSHEELVS